jgi:hypothetical protein
MDPNANLEEQRNLVAVILRADHDDIDITAAATRLAELVEALDQWLSNGGFLPADWPTDWVR